ncbi:MAG: hypothetical protein ACE5PO_05065, partial [Candidatus Bathyarchaeia archaeon]
YTDFLSTVAANPTLAMERAAGGTMQVPIMDRVVYMLPQQFGLIILTSILIGVYMSLLVFYSRRGKSCRRVGGYGVAGSGAGLSTSIVSVGVTASQVCGTGCSSILVSLPLVAGLGLNLFGVSYAVLFPVVSVAVLISAIYWIASKTRT